MYDEYEAQGFMVITLVAENYDEQPPTRAELMIWAAAHGIQHPVVADPYYEVTGRYVQGSSIGLPSMTLLGPGAELLSLDTPVDESDIVANLP